MLKVICYFVQGWSLDVSAEFEVFRKYMSMKSVVSSGQPVCILNAL